MYVILYLIKTSYKLCKLNILSFFYLKICIQGNIVWNEKHNGLIYLLSINCTLCEDTFPFNCKCDLQMWIYLFLHFQYINLIFSKTFFAYGSYNTNPYLIKTHTLFWSQPWLLVTVWTNTGRFLSNIFRSLTLLLPRAERVTGPKFPSQFCAESLLHQTGSHVHTIMYYNTLYYIVVCFTCESYFIQFRLYQTIYYF